MKKKRIKNNSKNTTNILLFVVFFSIFILSIILVKIYGENTYKKSTILLNEKIDKVLYQFFNDIVTKDIVKEELINNILEITKNDEGEILLVNYDLKSSYELLNNVSLTIKNKITDLEKGKIDVNNYDEYLTSNRNGLVLKVPLFISSNNIFINNWGPKIPIKVSFNENLLTNIKTKVTNYGFNNALLEIYITVEMQKLLITPIKKDKEKFNYDILISSLVINGRVPNYYGGFYENMSSILDIPMH